MYIKYDKKYIEEHPNEYKEKFYPHVDELEDGRVVIGMTKIMATEQEIKKYREFYGQITK